MAIRVVETTADYAAITVEKIGTHAKNRIVDVRNTTIHAAVLQK